MTGIHVVPFHHKNSMRRIALIINNGVPSTMNIVSRRDEMNPRRENSFCIWSTKNDASLAKSSEPDISAVPRMLMETVDVRVYQ
jgi:hypothetical protein